MIHRNPILAAAGLMLLLSACHKNPGTTHSYNWFSHHPEEAKAVQKMCRDNPQRDTFGIECINSKKGLNNYQFIKAGYMKEEPLTDDDNRDIPINE